MIKSEDALKAVLTEKPSEKEKADKYRKKMKRMANKKREDQ